MEGKRNPAASPALLLLWVTVGLGASAASFPEQARAQAAPGSIAAAAQADTAPSLTVRVNGAPVSFLGQQPTEQNGHLLVPLRGVLERLGAYVNFDDATQTVTAVRQNSQITLPIGQSAATVNGQPVTLDVPAQVVNGTTLVPLRFMAEALGAKVTYDVGSNTVAIDTPGAPERRRPDRHDEHHHEDRPLRAAGVLPSGETTVLGNIEAVYSDMAPARLLVRVAPDGGVPGAAPGSHLTLPLRPGAALTRERPDGPEEKITLDYIEIGDRVAVLRAPDGAAEAVNLLVPNPAPRQFLPPAPPRPAGDPVFKGQFQRADRQPRGLVRLQMLDGRWVEVPRDVPVLLGGDRIGLDELRPGDNVSIAIDPGSHLGTRILVSFRQ